jgi:hypothetical protein
VALRALGLAGIVSLVHLGAPDLTGWHMARSAAAPAAGGVSVPV